MKNKKWESGEGKREEEIIQEGKTIRKYLKYINCIIREVDSDHEI